MNFFGNILVIASIIYALIDDLLLMISFPYLICQGLIIDLALLYRKKDKKYVNIC